MHVHSLRAGTQSRPVPRAATAGQATLGLGPPEYSGAALATGGWSKSFALSSFIDGRAPALHCGRSISTNNNTPITTADLVRAIYQAAQNAAPRGHVGIILIARALNCSKVPCVTCAMPRAHQPQLLARARGQVHVPSTATSMSGQRQRYAPSDLTQVPPTHEACLSLVRHPSGTHFPSMLVDLPSMHVSHSFPVASPRQSQL